MNIAPSTSAAARSPRTRPCTEPSTRAARTQTPTAGVDAFEGMNGATTSARCQQGTASQAAQAGAAAEVKKGVARALQDAKGVAQALMQGGDQSFEDFAAQFDKDKMNQDLKDKKVASGTGVNHSKSSETQPSSTPSPPRR